MGILESTRPRGSRNRRMSQLHLRKERPAYCTEEKWGFLFISPLGGWPRDRMALSAKPRPNFPSKDAEWSVLTEGWKGHGRVRCRMDQ